MISQPRPSIIHLTECNLSVIEFAPDPWADMLKEVFESSWSVYGADCSSKLLLVFAHFEYSAFHFVLVIY